MKIILSTTLGLCIGFWSLNAAAGPFDQRGESRSRRDATHSIELEDHEQAQSFRGAMPSVLRNAHSDDHRSRPFRGTLTSIIQNDRSDRDEAREWTSERATSQPPALDTPRRLNAVAGIPEPSAAMLFGIGVLVALQAVPRRMRRS